MMKCWILTLLIAIPILSIAQNVTLDDLRAAEGEWIGKLEYRDYSSNEKVAIPANLSVEITQKNIILNYTYPNEPNAKSKDKIRLKDGKYLGDQTITLFEKGVSGFVLQSKSTGMDNSKEANFFHTFRVMDNQLEIRKDVQYIGETEKSFRNGYTMTR